MDCDATLTFEPASYIQLLHSSEPIIDSTSTPTSTQVPVPYATSTPKPNLTLDSPSARRRHTTGHSRRSKHPPAKPAHPYTWRISPAISQTPSTTSPSSLAPAHAASLSPNALCSRASLPQAWMRSQPRRHCRPSPCRSTSIGRCEGGLCSQRGASDGCVPAGHTGTRSARYAYASLACSVPGRQPSARERR